MGILGWNLAVIFECESCGESGDIQWNQQGAREVAFPLHCHRCGRVCGEAKVTFKSASAVEPGKAEPAKAPEKPALPEPEKKMVRKVQLEP